MERSESTDRDQVRNLVDGAADAIVQARDVDGGVHITLASKLHRVVPRELPPDVYGFVGREGQLQELDALVEQPGTSAAVISAVSGTAGVGKTALAIHWAHRVRDRFPDGDLYVDLQGFSLSQPVETTDVLAGFLRSLGVPHDAIPATSHERESRYRSVLTGRRVLIVLDNARTTEQVRPLLPGSGSCLVLVTSRDRLSDLVVAEGARRISLDVLTPEESLGMLRAMLGDRVGNEPAAAVELCEWAAQLPLALRIIGMRAHDRPHTPLAELARELADEHHRLDALEAAQGERWSVRVVFSWSYRHLPDEAARCFRLVACHPGRDFSLPSIVQLVNRPESVTQRQVDVLLRANLVEIATDGRLRMHDLVRTYAASLADQDEKDTALKRLLAYYVDQATTARNSAWLAQELSNLVAGFELAAVRGWDVHANRLYEVISGYLKKVPENRSVVGRPGDIPRVLVELENRKTLFAIDSGRRDRIELERAEALLHAGLSYEATRALLNIENAHRGRGLGEVQLLRAAAALLEEDYLRAQQHARVAMRVFDARDDPVRAGLAALVRLRALVAGTLPGDTSVSTIADYAAKVVERLTWAGLRNEADIARLLGHRVFLRQHKLADDAESILRSRPISSIDHLILLRLTRTELEIVRGNPQAALEHACRGLTELRRHRSWTSGLELVGGTVSYGLELVDAALALLAAHPPTDLGELLDWFELTRTNAFRYQPPGKDVAADVRVAEIRRLAENVELCRTVDSTNLTRPPHLSPQILAALGSRVLINFVAVADRVRALVVRDGEYHFADICDLGAAVELSRQLHADIDALAPDDLIRPLQTVVMESARRRSTELDEQLFSPLTDLTAGRALVIVPPTELYAVVWPALPSLTGQAITIAPSAAVWLSGATQAPRNGQPLAATGPDLPEPLNDVATFVELNPDAYVLNGGFATTSAVLNALNNATIAHLCAHGTHEPTNAAFSRLELADGGLLAHDIHTLATPPEHVVLATCELPLSNIRRHDEPLGFAGALLAGGTRTVTAALARVGHRSVAEALSEYHRAMATGPSPAAALAAVTAADPFRRPFVCLGWGG